MINILAVDDEDDIAALYKVFFKKEVRNDLVRLDCVSSGTACLEYLKAQNNRNIDIILCDINMPDMDGFEVLEKVKQINPLIKFFMISAYDSDEYLERAVNLGSEKYFTKPVDFPLLKKTIQDFYPDYKGS